MKIYTRVKAVTCALNVSAMLFSTAAMQTSASVVSYELPAAGVGLALDEGSSLGEAYTGSGGSKVKRLNRRFGLHRNLQI